MITLTSVSETRTSDAQKLDRLLALTAQRDNDAFAELYERSKAAVYGLALSILKNAQDAQDVLHDSFVSIHASAAGYRSRGTPMAWILTIARNHCLQKLREHSRRADLPPEDWEAFLEAREGMTPEDKLLIRQCMKLLSDQERQIVVLHAVAGFKHREIAQMLSLSVSTVLSKYSRALKKLRHQWEKGEITP